MSYAETNFRSELIRYLNARLKLENEKIKQLTRIANTLDDIYKLRVDNELEAPIPTTYVSPEVMESTKGGEYGRLTVSSSKDMLDKVNDLIKEVDKSQN